MISEQQQQQQTIFFVAAVVQSTSQHNEVCIPYHVLLDTACMIFYWFLNVLREPFFATSVSGRSSTPALGESTDRQTELEIMLNYSIPRVYTSP